MFDIDILLLAIACVFNSLSIIIHICDHRYRKRTETGVNINDLERANRLQNYFLRVQSSGDNFFSECSKILSTRK